MQKKFGRQSWRKRWTYDIQVKCAMWWNLNQYNGSIRKTEVPYAIILWLT